jgi:hypothetical protein
MSDYKISALASLDLSYRTATCILKTPDLAEAAKAFIDNMDRAVAMCTFPVRLLNFSQHFLREWLTARKKLIGDDNITTQNREKYLEVRARIAVEIPLFDPQKLDAIDGRGEEDKKERLEDGLVFLDAMVKSSDKFLSAAVESMLAGMVIGAWTAFEALAGDLWVAAVNCHPEKLSQLAGKQGNPAKGDTGRMLPLSLLEKYKFDLRVVMGTLLSDMEKVRFSKLDLIRDAYKAAFGDAGPNICSCLDNTALLDLSIVRNLIIHHGGVCDKEYEEKSSNRPLLPKPALGGPLKLDGLLVAGLLNPVIRCCVGLIKAVDEWLESQLPSPGYGAGI